jgi:hypothetical protein
MVQTSNACDKIRFDSANKIAMINGKTCLEADKLSFLYRVKIKDANTVTIYIGSHFPDNPFLNKNKIVENVLYNICNSNLTPKNLKDKCETLFKHKCTDMTPHDFNDLSKIFDKIMNVIGKIQNKLIVDMSSNSFECVNDFYVLFK